MRIAREEQGKGAPLLLIQALGYGRWSWEPIVPALAERYRVLWFDNRGIGESDKPEGPYTAKLMAGDALQVLDEAEDANDLWTVLEFCGKGANQAQARTYQHACGRHASMRAL